MTGTTNGDRQMTYNDLSPAEQERWDEIAASNEWWDGIDEYAEAAFESFVKSIRPTPETPDHDAEFTAIETAVVAEMDDIIRDNFDVIGYGIEYETDPYGKCRRCAGTGAFITMVENGVPKGPGGVCFRCNGKGHQTVEDARRNQYHDTHQTIYA